MFMVRLARGPRPSIYLYKHIFTRRYLNLDESGVAYRYFPPRDPDSRSHGQYRPGPSLDEALDHLELWELPWLKSGLEHERRAELMPGTDLEPQPLLRLLRGIG